MAKSASPIRLQADLMQAAESTAKRFHRSTAERVEYWADIGRNVSSVLDPDVLLSVLSGLTVIKAEPVFSPPINPNEVFQTLENERQSGVLTDSVTHSVNSYQASKEYPKYLEKIDQEGTITVGQFENGQFIALLDS